MTREPHMDTFCIIKFKTKFYKYLDRTNPETVTTTTVIKKVDLNDVYSFATSCLNAAVENYSGKSEFER